ncbi:bifunctional acyl-ACP--phospholipid O-acyltransferase/long-chain-fatty-acid--ACP ligase [Thorsellia kenyensis]|uniref:Bifunctional acyl-ACP--phospholipid O-acyltransferase/long-chain-fatty-acid--ACP ligase n=1 Tax=Thorsellia kenyensis TaxID=1549888 RepID=A0ABV6CCC8_9GAMM
MTLKAILKKIVKFLFKIEIKGNFDELKHKKIVITPNHVSLLDGILLALFLPKEPMFAIYSPYLEKAPLKWLKNQMKFFPVDHNNPFAIKQMVKEVSNGEPLVIFPEGRISVTGSLMKIYDGAGFIAAKTDAKIVPIRIEGAEFSKTSYLKGLVKVRWFPKITIHILPSRTLEMPTVGSSSERRMILGDKLHQIMMDAKVSVRPSISLWQSFLAQAKNYGYARPIMEDINNTPISYRGLIKRSIAVSEILNKSTNTEAPLGLLLPNTIAMASTFLAANLSAKVTALLNYTAGVQGITSAIKAAQIDTIVTSRAFIDKADLGHLVMELREVRWIYLEDYRNKLSIKDKLKIALYTFFPNSLAHSMKGDDEAVILFTSGSEGVPKGVVHTNNTILANVEQIKAVADFTVKDSFMSCLPLFHAFGLTAGLFTPLLCGSYLVLYPSPLHYRIIPEVIYEKRCTVLFGTSTFLQKYAEFAHPYDLITLRYVIAGAERLTEKTKEIWRNKFGIRVLEGYGVTECAPVISINLPMAYKANTIGRMLPLIEHRLQDVPGLAEGKLLFIKAPNLMKGYLRVDAPGVIEEPCMINEEGGIDKGWYDTGDIVHIDEDGYLQIKGRVKRFAKIAGEMISLESIENIAISISPESKHAAVALKEERKGERILFFTTDKTLTKEALKINAQSHGLPEIAIPKNVHYLDEMPMLGSGKVDFVKLNQKALLL